MKIGGKTTRSIWLEPDGWSVGIFDQRRLPWAIEPIVLQDAEAAFAAIADMATRGAPLIGAVAAYGLALALRADASDQALAAASARLFDARPTAVNLGWALSRMRAHLAPLEPAQRAAAAYADFVKKMAPTFLTLHDASQKLVRAVAVPAMPTTYLIGRDGKVRFIHAGYQGESTDKILRTQIDKLLAAN